MDCEISLSDSDDEIGTGYDASSIVSPSKPCKITENSTDIKTEQSFNENKCDNILKNQIDAKVRIVEVTGDKLEIDSDKLLRVSKDYKKVNYDSAGEVYTDFVSEELGIDLENNEITLREEVDVCFPGEVIEVNEGQDQVITGSTTLEFGEKKAVCVNNDTNLIKVGFYW